METRYIEHKEKGLAKVWKRQPTLTYVITLMASISQYGFLFIL